MVRLYILMSYINTVGKITITNAGSGYNSTPTITIGSPNEPWGITATAVPTVTNGFVTDVEILSSGRGYTSTPTITFSTPDVGINTATATIELLPTYYTVKDFYSNIFWYLYGYFQ